MAADQSIGFFGKLPVVGDFVVRRLSMAFAQQWDDWLQAGIARSKELLGEQWLNTYMVAPVWRFYLQPEVVDWGAWVGLMFPSVDRVGRYFPMSLFVPLPAEADPAALVTGHAPWFEQFEALALQALNPALQFEEWDRLLQDFGLPNVALRGSSEDSTVPIAQSVRQKYLRQVSASLLESGALLDQHARTQGPPRSVWWTDEAEAGTYGFQICEGLPDPDAFTALIDQDWGARGWVVRQSGTVAKEGE